MTFAELLEQWRLQRKGAAASPAVVVPRAAFVDEQRRALDAVLYEIAELHAAKNRQTTPGEKRRIEAVRGVTTGKRAAYLHMQAALALGVVREVRLEHVRAAVKAAPDRFREHQLRPSPRRLGLARRSVQELAAATELALASGYIGHYAKPGAAESFVQEEDLESLVPDGWGDLFPREKLQLARRIELPPYAVPLLCLLIWSSRCKEPHPKDLRGRGAGAQFSIAWLSRKVGCSPTWIKELLNRLDPHASYRRELADVQRDNERRAREGRAKRAPPPRPTGTPYVQRFRQLKRYERTEQRGGRTDVVWVDAAGKPRVFVDLRGVCYATDAGESLLLPRELDLSGRVVMRRNGMLIDLASRLMRIGIRVRKRLEATAEKTTLLPGFAGAG